MKFSERLQQSGALLLKAIRRFPAAFVALVLLTLIALTETIFHPDFDSLFYLAVGIGASFFLLLLFRLFGERTDRPRLCFSIGIALSLSAVIAALILPHVLSENMFSLSCVGVYGCLILLIAACIASDDPTLSGIVHLVKAALLSGIVFAILAGGISLCIFAFTNLIVEVSDPFPLYSSFCIVISAFCTLLFVAHIPEKGNVPTLPRVFRVLILYAELPLFLLLLTVLCLYFIKLIIFRELPSGVVNPLASVASAAFIINLFLLKPFSEEHRFARFFDRFGAFFMLPVIAVQAVAVGIRLSAYGLTSLRLLSLLFIFITFLFVLSSFFKKLSRAAVLVISAILLACLTLTPYNVLSIPAFQQTAALKQALISQGMLDGDTILPRSDVPASCRETIISTYSYLLFDEYCPEFIQKTEGKSFEEIFGFPEYDSPVVDSDYFSNLITLGDLDISPYRKIRPFGLYSYDEESYFVDLPDDTAGIQFDADKIFSFIDENAMNNESAQLPLLKLSDTVDLYIEYAERYSYSDEEPGFNISGYILIR